MFSLKFVLKIISLALFWFVLSGKTTPFMLACGLITAIIVAWVHPQNNPTPPTSPASWISSIFRSFNYVFWLIYQIISASIHVSKIILSPKMPIKPSIFRHQTNLKSPGLKALFGNSITLTPGTITIDIEENNLIVHKLDDSSASGIVSGDMENRISRIAGESQA